MVGLLSLNGRRIMPDTGGRRHRGTLDGPVSRRRRSLSRPHPRPRPRPRRRRAWPWVASAAVVAVLASATTAWALDTHAGEVARNVELAGRIIGGMGTAELRDAVADIAADESDRAVTIETPRATYETTASALGLLVDEDATVAAALDVGRREPLPLRPLSWLGRWAAPDAVAVRYRVDRLALEDRLADLEGPERTPPTEPDIEPEGAGRLRAVEGEPGQGIPGEALEAALLDSAARDQSAITVHLAEGPLPPRFSTDEAEDLAAEAELLARTPLTITLGGGSVELLVRTVARWFRLVPGQSALELEIDQEMMEQDLAALFPQATRAAVNASFTVEAGAPVLHPGSDGATCCAASTAGEVLAALREGKRGMTARLRRVPAALTTGEAQGLAIVEEVGQPLEFGPTTAYPCCQPRVQNIHRIADLVRGVIIEPGERFSLNDHVGERTTENGFVEAPVIYDGRFDTDVGGGVSQFATTLFNAAFFAGLDVPVYQSHTLVISRYPRGREATVSYPTPDLVIENPTPYGVLLWPTYDATTITVHVFSTHHVDVVAEATADVRTGACTRVTTPRVRTYLDGRVERDSFSALYQPAEGVRC